MICKKLFLFFLVFLPAFSGFSQSVRYITGSKIQNFDIENFNLFDEDSSNIYVFSEVRDDYYLTAFDKDSVKRTFSIKIPLPRRDSIKYHLRNLFVRIDTFQILYSYFDKLNTFEKLEVISFDKNGVKYREAQVIDTARGNRPSNGSRFFISERKDKSEFTSFSFLVVKDSVMCNLDHFNYSGDKTSSANFTLDTKVKHVVYNCFSDYGEYYHIKRSKRGSRNLHWSMQIYLPNSNSFKDIPLNQPAEKKVFLFNDFEMYFDGEHEARFVTPYSVNKQSFIAEGVYIVKIDLRTHELMSENVIPFRMEKDSLSVDSGMSLSSCFLLEKQPLKNDGTRFIFQTRISQTTSLYGIPVSKQYNFGNILTVDIDSGLKVTRMHKVKNHQYISKSNGMFLGFCSLFYNEDTYFIYNELPENIRKPPEEMKIVTTGKLDNTVVISTRIGEEKAERKILISGSTEKDIDAIIPWTGFQSRQRNQTYVVRKIGDDFYMTKIFVTD